MLFRSKDQELANPPGNKDREREIESSLKRFQWNHSSLSLQMHAPTLRVLAVQLAHRNSPTGDRESHQFENPQPHAEPSLW